MKISQDHDEFPSSQRHYDCEGQIDGERAVEIEGRDPSHLTSLVGRLVTKLHGAGIIDTVDVADILGYRRNVSP